MGKEGEGWDRESGLCRGFGLSAYAVLLCIDHRGPAVRLVPWNTHYEWDTHYEARAPFRVVAETQRCRTGVRAFFLLQFNREGGATKLVHNALSKKPIMISISFSFIVLFKVRLRLEYITGNFANANF